MDTLNLTTQWDKTFPKSDKSHHRKVTFHNHYGITLAVDLYTPVNASGKLPATPKPSENAENITPDEEKSIVLSVDGDTLDITWEKNESVDSLLNLLRSGDITVRTTRYGGFEQVGSLPQSLPRDDVQMSTQAGNIVFYLENQIVLFYGSNSWAYTTLGHINGLSAEELTSMLGNELATIFISIH